MTAPEIPPAGPAETRLTHCRECGSSAWFPHLVDGEAGFYCTVCKASADPEQHDTIRALFTPEATPPARDPLREHCTVIDDALDKVICEQRAALRVREYRYVDDEERTQLAVVDAYLEVLEAARSALRAALTDRGTV